MPYNVALFLTILVIKEFFRLEIVGHKARAKS